MSMNGPCTDHAYIWSMDRDHAYGPRTKVHGPMKVQWTDHARIINGPCMVHERTKGPCISWTGHVWPMNGPKDHAYTMHGPCMAHERTKGPCILYHERAIAWPMNGPKGHAYHERAMHGPWTDQRTMHRPIYHERVMHGPWRTKRTMHERYLL